MIIINNKIFKRMTYVVLIIGTVLFNEVSFSEAKIVEDMLPLLTYSDHIVYTYDRPNGKRKGSISPLNSLVMVKKIQSDGWAYGSYKVMNSNKRVNRWFKMSDLQGYIDFQNYEATAYQDFIAKRTRTNQSKNLGHIAKNDKVIVVAQKGDSVKIIFKDEANNYRMGWIPSYILDENSSNVNNINDEFVAPDYGLNLDEDSYNYSNENISDEVINDDDSTITQTDEYNEPNNYPENVIEDTEK